MTVCIAARCGALVIAASDMMLTSGDVQFEPGSGLKIQAFSNFSFIMTAGDAALAAELVQATGAAVRTRIESEPNNFWNIKDIVDVFIDKYNLAKLKRAETQILAPLNLNRHTFISEQRILADGLVTDLTKELINFDMPHISCIIAGIDLSGSHIFIINDNQYTCADSIGFAAIGIGARHAQSQLMLSGHSFMSTIPETALAVYIAKKRAEVAPGVGTGTDMVSVGVGIPFDRLHPNVMQKLDEEYKKIVRAENEALSGARKEIASYVEELTQAATQRGTGDLPQEVPNADGGKGGAPSDRSSVR